MSDISLWVVVMLAPAVAFWTLAKLYVIATTWDFRPWPRQPHATRPGVEVLAQNLRTLQQEFQRIQNSDLPAVTVRLEAVSLAYDDVLLDCCRALGVEPPHQPPLDPIARMRVELELAHQGLVW